MKNRKMKDEEKQLAKQGGNWYSSGKSIFQIQVSVCQTDLRAHRLAAKYCSIAILVEQAMCCFMIWGEQFLCVIEVDVWQTGRILPFSSQLICLLFRCFQKLEDGVQVCPVGQNGGGSGNGEVGGSYAWVRNRVLSIPFERTCPFLDHEELYTSSTGFN